jgi:hypothetical protein
VEQGNFSMAEELLTTMHKQGWIEQRLTESDYSMHSTSLSQDDSEMPKGRGGHQMCIDSDNGVLYLDGGWDGKLDMGDLWSYNLRQNKWTLLMADTSACNGPGPRSCHRICLDPVKQHMYCLGYYLEMDLRTSMENWRSDFFRYDIIQNKWVQLSSNTFYDGGPGPIYDHQMALDAEARILYVLGGIKIHTEKTHMYSGFYAYHVETGEWKTLRPDSDAHVTTWDMKIVARSGHNLIHDPTSKCLYLFAGQFKHNYLNDVHIYDITTDTFKEITLPTAAQPGPGLSYSQRATFDTTLQQVYFYGGLLSNSAEHTTFPSTSFWIFKLKGHTWHRAHEHAKPSWPVCRFAHQMVYDPTTRIHYVYGGNPGNHDTPTSRLGDFWQLELVQPNADESLTRCTFLIRKQQYLEMCASGNHRLSIHYLRTRVSACVDQDKESSVLHQLASCVFSPPPTAQERRRNRLTLYKELVAFIPSEERGPSDDLIDLLPIEH